VGQRLSSEPKRQFLHPHSCPQHDRLRRHTHRNLQQREIHRQHHRPLVQSAKPEPYPRPRLDRLAGPLRARLHRAVSILQPSQALYAPHRAIRHAPGRRLSRPQHAPASDVPTAMEGRVEHGAAVRDDAAGQRRAAGQERAVGRHRLVVAAAGPPVGA